ncbi:hypothetical protein INR79_01600 [Vibrio sp. SCSIO 43132]|uniref:hypothetical protein n=1 Tax=Vibrio TaxID=662 RepID=UPI0005F9F4E6|nr:MULTISPECIES: hypothetical protein [Vibrio]KJY81209.1 hypothetical protein TW74_02685 [Vibrio nigripulchritudo]UAB70648.1 hypothetical protein INR79_01600 [Vibrio sp. SCSIO 43132]
MKTLSLTECRRDLEALEAAEVLTSNLKGEIERFRKMDMKGLMKQAMPMLMSGNLSLEALGLPSNFFEQLEQLERINGVARGKLRARIVADQHELESIEEAHTTEGTLNA